MKPVAKLAGFAAVLVLAFGGAAFAGSRIDVRPGKQTAEQPEAHGMGAADSEREGGHGGDGAAPQAVRGLAVSEGGLMLKLTRNTATAGKRSNVAFRIVDRGGRAVRDFDVEHSKRMHVMVVRRDMTGFQHVHPTQRVDGTWSVPVTLREPGSYRVFADFSVAGKAYTVADDLTVDGTVRSQQLPAPVDSVNVDGMRVSLTEGASDAGGKAELGFEVTRDGEPVAIEDYLGAKGHLVALRQGDLAFLHVHPDENALKFMATFPTAGNYRLFLQFQTAGRVHTAAFTQAVAR